MEERKIRPAKEMDLPFNDMTARDKRFIPARGTKTDKQVHEAAGAAGFDIRLNGISYQNNNPKLKFRDNPKYKSIKMWGTEC